MRGDGRLVMVEDVLQSTHARRIEPALAGEFTGQCPLAVGHRPQPADQPGLRAREGMEQVDAAFQLCVARVLFILPSWSVQVFYFWFSRGLHKKRGPCGQNVSSLGDEPSLCKHIEAAQRFRPWQKISKDGMTRDQPKMEVTLG